MLSGRVSECAAAFLPHRGTFSLTTRAPLGVFQASEAALVGFTKLANKEVNALCLVDADGKVSRAGGPVRNACMRV